MEDAHSIYLANGIGVFGVFDGHAGRQCSQFVAQEFPEMVARCNTAQLSPQVLEHICLELDENWIITQNDDSGSTAAFVVAVPRPQDYQLWCGNIGDARVLLGRGTQLLHATTDHKPTMPVEVARIQNCGGWVDFGSGRVDGMLAVSRAFGDRRFKAGGPVQLQQKVIAQPSIARYEAAPGDFVVVACDGIFEKGFCNEEVVEFVGTALARNPDSAIACSALCEEALRRGSGDNMTAMIVQLQDGSGHQGQDFLPPPYIIGNTNSTSGFEGFCREAGFTVAQALEVRKNLVQEQNQPHFRHVYPPEIQIGMERELGFFGSNCPGNDTPAAQRQLFYERLAAFYEELKHNSENPQLPDPRDEIPTTQVEQPTEPRPEPLQKRTFSGSNMGIQVMMHFCVG
jgi:serine/threonine protein phosphatase PrpC